MAADPLPWSRRPPRSPVAAVLRGFVPAVRDEDVLAWFLDGDGQQTRFPAIVATEQTGSRRVYFAGMPTVGSYALPERAFAVPNPAPRVFRNAAEWAAGRPAVLRLEGFPPLTAYRRARPEDSWADPRLRPGFWRSPATRHFRRCGAGQGRPRFHHANQDPCRHPGRRVRLPICGRSARGVQCGKGGTNLRR